MMWEVFGAQCDRELMRSKELLASLPTPTEGVNNIKEECSRGTHKQTNKTNNNTHLECTVWLYTDPSLCEATPAYSLSISYKFSLPSLVPWDGPVSHSFTRVDQSILAIINITQYSIIRRCWNSKISMYLMNVSYLEKKKMSQHRCSFRLNILGTIFI